LSLLSQNTSCRVLQFVTTVTKYFYRHYYGVFLRNPEVYAVSLSTVTNISIDGRHTDMPGSWLRSSLQGTRPDMTCEECSLSLSCLSPRVRTQHMHRSSSQSKARTAKGRMYCILVVTRLTINARFACLMPSSAWQNVLKHESGYCSRT
jgi:hypothetical protein